MLRLKRSSIGVESRIIMLVVCWFVIGFRFY